MSARREIPQWPGYFVDEGGNVWSAKRGTWRRLAVRAKEQGYCWVQLTVGGRSKSVLVHRLMEFAFGLPGAGRLVRHLNGDPADNRLMNLRRGTDVENAADRERHGRTARGERNRGGNKLSEKQVIEIKRALRDGSTLTSLASRFDVSIATIGFIRTGRLWRHVA